MPETSLQNWERISTRKIIEDLPWLRLSVEHVKLPNGKKIKKFYQVQMPEYAIVVAITSEGLIVMENQYKHAVGKVILNLPGGYLGEGESPLIGAQRELLEETGFRADSWLHLGSFWVDGNRGCGKMHSFVASGGHRLKEPQNEDTEELEVVLKKPEDALALLFDGGLVTLGPALALSLAFLSPLSPLAMPKVDVLNDRRHSQNL